MTPTATAPAPQDMQLLDCIKVLSQLTPDTQRKIVNVLSGMCMMAQMDSITAQTGVTHTRRAEQEKRRRGLK